MNKEAILKWAEERMAKHTCEPLEPGYRFHHGLRVGGLAVSLGKRLGVSQAQLDLLYVAGVVHDVGKSGYLGTDAHGPRGEAIVRARLTEWLDKDEMERVAQMVAHHYERPRSQWYKGKVPPQWSDDILIIQDADILDHYGMTFVWSAVLRAHKDGLSPMQMLETFWRGTHERDVRDEAHRSLNFEESRAELNVRFEKAELFFRALFEEQMGEFTE